MAKPKKQDIFDDSFYKLAAEVTKSIAENKDGSDQKEQVELLLSLEIKFKETILKFKQSTKIYEKFIQKVCITNKNILSARPYFRESAVSFSKRVTPHIKVASRGKAVEALEAIEKIKEFDINYQLISFIRDSWLGPFPKKAEILFQKVHTARETLIENNMPLAINRAKLFYRKTPKGHLSLIDMISISSMGLIAAIDKFTGKYTTVFRSVIVGRAVGNLIDAYSETMLHFYPADRRLLYKAHSIRGRQGIDNPKELAAAVNQSFKEDGLEGVSVPKKETDESELAYLMQAASTVSADQTVNVDDGESFGVYDFTSDGTDLEKEFAEQEELNQMLMLIAKLPMIHRKVLRLKGIKL